MRNNPDDSIFHDNLQRLMRFPNVLVPIHQSFFTIEIRLEIASARFDNLSAYQLGAECANLVSDTY